MAPDAFFDVREERIVPQPQDLTERNRQHAGFAARLQRAEPQTAVGRRMRTAAVAVDRIVRREGYRDVRQRIDVVRPLEFKRCRFVFLPNARRVSLRRRTTNSTRRC